MRKRKKKEEKKKKKKWGWCGFVEVMRYLLALSSLVYQAPLATVVPPTEFHDVLVDCSFTLFVASDDGSSI